MTPAEKLEIVRDELRVEVTSEKMRLRAVASTNGHSNGYSKPAPQIDWSKYQ